jgi:hypothetical protein
MKEVICDAHEEEEDGGKSEPTAKFLSALNGTDIVSKYLMKCDDDDPDGCSHQY